MNDDADRAQILRRRALFMSSALAALGCSGPAGSAKGAPVPPVVSVPPPGAGADAGTEAPPKASPRSPPDGEMPPLDVPEGMGDDPRQQFDRLYGQVRDAHALLERLEKALPGDCTVTNAACDTRWRSIADGLLEYEEMFRFMQPICKGSSAAAKLWEERARAHLEYLSKRRGRLDARIVELVQSEPARTRWDQHQQDAQLARPQICLSFACTDW
jgi:hypothetical protein